MSLKREVAIAGGSGVVGARLIEVLLARGDIAQVFALGRRPLEKAHPKLRSEVVDFGDAASIEAALPQNLDFAFCCLGTTMKKAGSAGAFRAIDLDAAIAFARASRARGATRFVLVSSLGANAKSRNLYLRTKGELEAAVATLGFQAVAILRPSFIDDEGRRSERRSLEALSLPVWRFFSKLLGEQSRYATIRASTIARSAATLAFADAPAPLSIVLSDGLQKLGAESSST